METVKTDGVILKTYPLAEKDRILVIYTRVLGKISGVVSRTTLAPRHGLGKVEPFSLVELVILVQAQRDLVKVQNVELIRAFGTKLPSYENFLQLSLIAEILLETSPDREPNDDLFRLLILVLPHFENQDSGGLAGLYFKVWYLKIAGFLPATRVCQRCARILAEVEDVFVVNGLTGLVCGSCRVSPDQPLSRSAYRLLSAIRENSLNHLESEKSNIHPISELSSLAEDMLERNFERHFQSLQLLRGEGA